MSGPLEDTVAIAIVSWNSLPRKAVTPETDAKLAAATTEESSVVASPPSDWPEYARAMEIQRNAARAELAAEKSRMDWLESNILALFHGRATCSVQMDGRNVTLQYTDRNHRKLRLSERSIRAAIDAAKEGA
jgi:hypothetical protein